MASPVMRLTPDRLVLRHWHDDDRAPFAAMHADAEVMHDMGGALDRSASDHKFDRYAAAFDDHGYGRWVIEGATDGADPCLLGHAGVMPNRGDHPLGAHDDVGWRLRRCA